MDMDTNKGQGNQNLDEYQDNPYGNVVYGQPYNDNKTQYINTSNPAPI